MHFIHSYFWTVWKYWKDRDKIVGTRAELPAAFMAAVPNAGILYRLGEKGHKVSEIAICLEAEVKLLQVFMV